MTMSDSGFVELFESVNVYLSPNMGGSGPLFIPALSFWVLMV